MERQRIDLHTLVAQTFGILTVRERVENDSSGSRRWRCECACGGTTIARTRDLRSGNTTSCGCAGSRTTIGARSLKHGASRSRDYVIWCNMKARCTDPEHPGWQDYGGRGISVCAQWADSFQTFTDDMGPCPPGMSIDRRDNDGNYTPQNCRWATTIQQANNKRSSRHITAGGMTLTLAQWSERVGLTPAALHRRLRLWPLEQALNMSERPYAGTGTRRKV
nr:hypothetical protein [uncultured Lichenicoccus sp.]